MHPSTKLLVEARKEIKFPLEELTKLLYGDERWLHLVTKSQEIFDASDDMQNNPNYHNLSRKDKILHQVKKLKVVRQHVQVDTFDDWITVLNYSQSQTFTAVFYGMVVPALRILGTDEQIKRWEHDFLSLDIIACYAQTEVGHGSDVQNLKTIATFDPQTDEFIVHSPSIEAYKYWPGELGLLSNWALVYAQLIIGGKSQGVHPFMVPIRDMNTHKPLKGVIVGDIGPKLGYESKDNGYLGLNQVRIPRDYLLQRFTKVSRDGVVTRHGNEKVSYSAMMLIRKMLVSIFSRLPAQALTIAIRYSITRQQFKNDHGVENQVIEYQSQQDKLFPLLAKQYAIIFGGLFGKRLAEDNFERVQRKDFTQFQLTHSILSGCKAYYTQFAIDCSEWCRLSCGGHGFANYSGLPMQYLEGAANATLEGENKIMYLQLTRYLLKIVQQAQKSPKNLPQEFEFLKDTNQILEKKVQDQTEQGLMQLSTLQHYLTQNAILVLLDCVNKIQHYATQGIPFKEIWDFKAAIGFIELHNFRIFAETIKGIENNQIKTALTPLCQLLGVKTVLSSCSQLIEEGLITPLQLQIFNNAQERLLPIIRKDAIGLVDAFAFSDKALKSLIGCYDGKPYERIYDWVSNENTMNKHGVMKGITQLKNMNPKL